MKREIKLRAFVKSLNKVLDVVEIRFLANEVGVGTRHDWHYHDIKDVELMQYTGIKDKNGVEIYEGDILEGNGIGVLVWFDDRFGVGSGKINNYHVVDEISKYEMEINKVIGNIYENPELCH